MLFHLLESSSLAVWKSYPYHTMTIPFCAVLYSSHVMRGVFARESGPPADDARAQIAPALDSTRHYRECKR